MSMAAAPLTPAEAERGYNNRAAVPDHPEWFGTWARLSSEARTRLRPRLDLRYGPNPNETLDLFVPDGRARGTLVFIHGGYWRALDKADHSFVAGPFIDEGIAVAVLNYDLCPAVTIATIVDECRRALAWVVREGPRHGAGAATVVVAGHSAGGHLSAMLLATPADAMGLTAHPLAGAVSLSGVHDLRPMTLFSYNADLRLNLDEAARLSPNLLAPATKAPILAAVGADETAEFLRQAQVIWDAWPANRPPGTAGPLVIPHRHHFSVVADYADGGSALTKATVALF
jgi:arylformamidase